MNNYNDEDILLMLKIRKFEKTLLELFSQGNIFGTTHTCLGQEYIPTALKPFIKDTDFVISNHRGHGHFIAFTGEIEGLLAEIMGKEGAVCNSAGGSQHLFYKNVMTTGVQGEGVSVALGIAWSFKRENNENLSFVFVGDGTFGRGSVYESLNMACLYELPYVMIVENNNIAMTTKSDENMSGSIEDRVKSFGANYIKITSNIPNEIRIQITDSINYVRKNSHPLVIEFVTSRVSSHSKGDDCRAAEELEIINNNYWYNILKKQNNEKFEFLEQKANKEIEDILKKTSAKKEITLVL